MSSSLTNFPPEYLEANTSGRLVASVTTVLIAATILLALRAYARTLTSAPRGWDDYCLIPAWISLLVASILTYLSITKAGAGYHYQVVLAKDPAKAVVWGKLLWIMLWFYAVSITTSRLSVTFLYLRIFTSKWSRFWCWCMVAYLICDCLSVFLELVNQCNPVTSVWASSTSSKCDNYVLYYQIYPFFNVLADVGIAVLPIKTIWSLKASTPRKIGILLVFSTGSVGLLASCIRTSEFFTDASDIISDPTWVAVPLEGWTIIEAGMYLSAACSVGLRPLFLRNNRVRRSSSHQTTFGLSSFRGHLSRPAAAHFKSPGFDELQSSSNLANHIDTALDEHRRIKNQGSHQSLADGQIRVNTEIEIRTEEGTAAVHGFDFS